MIIWSHFAEKQAINQIVRIPKFLLNSNAFCSKLLLLPYKLAIIPIFLNFWICISKSFNVFVFVEAFNNFVQIVFIDLFEIVIKFGSKQASWLGNLFCFLRFLDFGFFSDLFSLFFFSFFLLLNLFCFLCLFYFFFLFRSCLFLLVVPFIKLAGIIFSSFNQGQF